MIPDNRNNSFGAPGIPPTLGGMLSREGIGIGLPASSSPRHTRAAESFRPLYDCVLLWGGSYPSFSAGQTGFGGNVESGSRFGWPSQASEEQWSGGLALHGRLTGPVQFVVALIEAWRLDRKSAVSLLGFESIDLRHVDELLNGRAPLKGRDAKDRIAHLFEIRRTLSALFRSLDVENSWLRESHSLLNNLSPMKLLLEGSMENLLLVKEYVLTAAGR